MRKLLIIFVSFFFFYSCRKNSEHIELEILNNDFICYSGDKHYFFSEEYQKKYLTIYRYKIKNNSKKKYIFNLDVTSKFLYKEKEYFNGKDILFFNSDSDSLDVYGRINNSSNNCKENYFKYIESNLGNRFLNIEKNKLFKVNNFTLNPGEIKYIENYVILPYGDDYNNNSIKLKKGKNYFVNLKIWSDSTDTKNFFNDSELKTFKENGYEFFHGTVISKNKVPLKMVE